MAEPLAAGEVVAFHAFVDGISPEVARERLLPLLDGVERERHGRFRFDEHRHLFLVAHALCRTVLAKYTAVAPAQLRFETLEHGKPVLAAGMGDPGLRFNLSHTAGLAAVVVARDEVGIDVERFDRRVELEMVAKRVFSPVELTDLMAREGDDRRRRFFELWTLKEAYVKALGDGLTAPLQEITVSLGSGTRPMLTSSHETGPAWLHLEAPSSEHALALALRGAEPSKLRVAQWTPF